MPHWFIPANYKLNVCLKVAHTHTPAFPLFKFSHQFQQLQHILNITSSHGFIYHELKRDHTGYKFTNAITDKTSKGSTCTSSNSCIICLVPVIKRAPSHGQFICPRMVSSYISINMSQLSYLLSHSQRS